MKMLLTKLKLLTTKQFWSYKEIAEFYEMSVSRAVRIKREAEETLFEGSIKGKKKRGINQFNSDLINADIILKRVSNKDRLEKIREFIKLLEIYDGKKGEGGKYD